MSDAPGMPPEVLELVRERISSIEQLEVLLLLRAQAARAWRIGELSRELNVSEASVASALADLHQRKLVRLVADGTICFGPETPRVAAAVDALAETYAKSRVETLVLISSNAIDRVRRDALRTFSEAFRLKGPKKNG